MMKWLRLHSKKIMVAVVLLAMFSFVGGSALYNMFRTSPSDVDAMDVFGVTYTQQDLLNAQSETEILESLFVDWTNGVGRNDLNARHWFMLALEAERSGIAISDKEVTDFLEAKDSELRQNNAGSIAEIRTTRHYSMASMRSAVARQLAIQRNYSRVLTAAMPSEPQVQHYVSATQDKVTVTFASLDASKWVDSTEQIDEGELQAQFDKYKDVLASESENGFGYKHPRRVRVQFVSASIGKIESQIQVSLDEVKSQWKANPAKYMKTITVDEMPASAPASTQPVEPKKVNKQVQKTFSEARQQIEQELRTNKANRLARQAMTRLAEELARVWSESKIDESTGYRPIPKGVEDPTYLSAAADQVGSRLGIKLDYQETALVGAADLDNNLALRGVETPGDDDKPMTLSEFAFRVPGFYKPEREQDASLRLQLFQTPLLPLTKPGTPSFAFEGGRIVSKPGDPAAFILFRVVETRDSQTPESLAEVRAKVESDVRLMHAYQRMEPAAIELCAAAQRIGLDMALTKFDELRTQRGVTRTQNADFARMSRISDNDAMREHLLAGRSLLDVTSVPGVGSSKKFIDECFEMAADDWQPTPCNAPDSAAVQAATTQPAIEPAPKVRTIGIEKLHRRIVVQLTGHKPVDSDAFSKEQRQTAYQTIMGEKGYAIRMAWFDAKKVETRCAYVDRSGGEGKLGSGFVRPDPIPPTIY